MPVVKSAAGGLGFWWRPEMKFGLIYHFRNPPTWKKYGPDLYAEVLEHVQEVERLGFDSVWISEHHFLEDGYMPSVLPAAAALAARTRTIRIGTWVLLLPLHNPVRVVEDALVVDQLADGRFELGVGLGYRREEFKAFGIRRQDRATLMEEGLGILTKGLQGERVTVNGVDIKITPTPSHGEVRMYVASRSKAAALRAARHRCHLMPSGTRALYDAYARELTAQGEDPMAKEVVALVPWFVTDDPERVWRLIQPHVDYQDRLYSQWFAEAEEDPAAGHGYVVGTPDVVIEKLTNLLADQPYTEVISWAVAPGGETRLASESARLFAESVLPNLRPLTGNRSVLPVAHDGA